MRLNPDEFPQWDEFLGCNAGRPCPVWSVVIALILIPTLAALFAL